MNGAAAFAHGERVYSKPIPVQSVRRELTAADDAGVSIIAEIDGKQCANFKLKNEADWLDYERVDFIG